MMSCSQLFVMLPNCFSGSQVLGRIQSKSWEYAKNHWSMINMWEHHAICRNFDPSKTENLEGDLLRTATKWVFWQDLGKMVKVWEQRGKKWSTCMKCAKVLPNFFPCSHIHSRAPKKWDRNLPFSPLCSQTLEQFGQKRPQNLGA